MPKTKNTAGKEIGKQIREIFLSTIFIGVLVFYWYVFRIKALYAHVDFLSFFSAAVLLRAFPTNLYDIATQTQYQLQVYAHTSQTISFEYLPFVNHPIILLFFFPFTYFHPQVAYIYLLVLSMVIFFVTVFLLKKKFPIQMTLVTSLGILSFPPVFLTIIHTQNSFISLLLFLLIFIFLQKKLWFLVGLVASFLLFKPQLLLILFFYLLWLKKRKIYEGFVMGSFLLLVFLLIATQGNIWSFIQINQWYISVYEAKSVDNILMISLQGLITQVSIFTPSFPIRLFALVFSVLVGIWTLKNIVGITPKDRRFPYVYASIIIATLLVGMHVHMHDAVLLLFPFFVYMKYRRSYTVSILIVLGWIITFLAVFSSYRYFLPTVYLISMWLITIRWLNKE